MDDHDAYDDPDAPAGGVHRDGRLGVFWPVYDQSTDGFIGTQFVPAPPAFQALHRSMRARQDLLREWAMPLTDRLCHVFVAPEPF
jgi:hypothetical protein